jgi:membrane protease subunit (stomatin/prohibitin family)
MMGMKMGGHAGMKKSMAAMEKKEYSKKGLSPKAMEKHEAAEYGKGKKCPKCGKANCGCKY